MIERRFYRELILIAIMALQKRGEFLEVLFDSKCVFTQEEI
jgi:hypothetical protein